MSPSECAFLPRPKIRKWVPLIPALALLMLACLFSLERCIIRASRTNRTETDRSEPALQSDSQQHYSSSLLLSGDTHLEICGIHRSQNVERIAKLNLVFLVPKCLPASLSAGKVSAFLTTLRASLQAIICPISFHPWDSYQQGLVQPRLVFNSLYFQGWPWTANPLASTFQVLRPWDDAHTSPSPVLLQCWRMNPRLHGCKQALY